MGRKAPNLCRQCGASIRTDGIFTIGQHIKGCRLAPLPRVSGIRVIMRGGIPKVDWVSIERRTKTRITYLYQGRKYIDALDAVIVPRHSLEEDECRDIWKTAQRLFNDAAAVKTQIALLQRRIYGDSLRKIIGRRKTEKP